MPQGVGKPGASDAAACILEECEVGLQLVKPRMPVARAIGLYAALHAMFGMLEHV